MNILDHGYVKFIEAWGSDERIIESARMSTDKGFLGWGDEENPGDEKLLAYLWNNKHSTPFEFAGMTLEIKAPIMVFREWHRHRTQCLSGNTLLHFSLPSGKIYHKTIKEIVDRWNDNPSVQRKDKQSRSLQDFNKQTISNLALRYRKENGELGLTKILNAWKSGEKECFNIFCGDKVITASADHRFLTPKGWKITSELLGEEIYLEGLQGDVKENYFINFTDEELKTEIWKSYNDQYEVSNLGRIKSLYNTRGKLRLEPLIKKITVNKSKRAVVNINNSVLQVSRLVSKLFLSETYSESMQVLHKDDNSLDNRLSNLYNGNAQDNSNDQKINGGMKKYTFIPTLVSEIVPCGIKETYDIEVLAEEHNFVANGFVTHNSYNEMSARYVPLPDENYIPTLERVMAGANTVTTNKQAQNNGKVLTEIKALNWLEWLDYTYQISQIVYQLGIDIGIPKELARLPVPVARYSRMRVTANLRNWLAFLTLRDDPAAQYEIRVYAQVVCKIIEEQFSRTHTLYAESKVKPETKPVKLTIWQSVKQYFLS